MKKLGCMVLMLCIGLLTGCGTTLEGEKSIVYVGKNGSVTSLDVEELAESYYDTAELESFVQEEVAAYETQNGKGTVKLDELTVEEGTAKLRMKYKTPEDYTAFNGIELYQGTVIDSLSAGYVYDGPFVCVENGTAKGEATKRDIYEQEDLKVVIIRANTDVLVDGEICYVSSENVALTGADSVSIREGYYLNPGAAASGTEAVAASGEAGSTEFIADVQQPQEGGSFETDVYTFIVYK